MVPKIDAEYEVLKMWQVPRLIRTTDCCLIEIYLQVRVNLLQYVKIKDQQCHDRKTLTFWQKVLL